MIDSKRLLLCASATVLSLALAPVMAQTESAPAAPAAEAAPAPAGPGDAARAEMQKRMEAAMAERNKRYEELRKRASEVGLDLPESPPWAQAGMPQQQAGMYEPPAGMGEPPAMPEGMPMPGYEAPEYKPMTREEFDAMRKERWEAMRERAAEMGRELPETPPWEAAEQRRKEMMEKYEQYRATIEAMTDEQKEAISALFGSTAGAGPMGGCPRWHGTWQRGRMPYYGMGPGAWPGMMPMPSEEEEAPEAAQPAD
ncbi:MAG: hypothetical protein LJE69_04190 [Thiohalocapsa sp.]|uniref:hypothetical protein n=1 Tax=Thiohalocapsa sp. TaxID=2497641 RepID=UPI0025D41DE9|nr:hypothetical protein [Thiohalocapsa sp.]MCG6940433.1 hypothetical protein [Thiohalocapsa sp.]